MATERTSFTQLRNMYRNSPVELMWARVDTRFHVYPAQHPRQLALHNWEGWWLPQPDGTWYKSPVSFEPAGPAHTPELRGIWVERFITKCNDRDVTLKEFVHAEDAPADPRRASDTNYSFFDR